MSCLRKHERAGSQALSDELLLSVQLKTDGSCGAWFGQRWPVRIVQGSGWFAGLQIACSRSGELLLRLELFTTRALSSAAYRMFDERSQRG